MDQKGHTPQELNKRLRSLEDDLLWEVEVSASMSDLANKLMLADSIQNISSTIVRHGLYLTESQNAFIGYVEEKTQRFICTAVIPKNKNQSVLPSMKMGRNPPLDNWDWVLTHKRSFLTNSPRQKKWPQSSPLGSFVVKRFISAPALIDGKLIGLIGLINSDRPYRERDLVLVKRLAVLFALAVQRWQADSILQQTHKDLEKRVEERTDQLSRANKKLQAEITFRKYTERQIKETKNIAEAANRAKSEFLANMSHEVRTPLNHIIGFTEMVADKKLGDLNEIQEEYLNDVLSSSRHLLSLINDILDLSKVEAGKLELEKTDIHLRKLLINNSINIVKEKALKNHITFKTKIDDIPEIVRADERKLKQIIYNLLSNAVKFTPEGGNISISAKRAFHFEENTEADSLRRIYAEAADTNRDSIQISISDTGIGLREETLARIFKPFEQAESAANRRFEGTGLGLSLTKKLVELHGGKIWAESEGENKGTTFHFTIPLELGFT